MNTITPDEKVIDAYVTVLSVLPSEVQKEIISRLEWNLHDNNPAFTNETAMKNVDATEAIDPS
jgi:hypothetical protein